MSSPPTTPEGTPELEEEASVVSSFIRFGTVIVSRQSFLDAELDDTYRILSVRSKTPGGHITVTKTTKVDPRFADNVMDFVLKYMEKPKTCTAKWEPRWSLAMLVAAPIRESYDGTK